jgi:hypothetical protein
LASTEVPITLVQDRRWGDKEKADSWGEEPAFRKANFPIQKEDVLRYWHKKKWPVNLLRCFFNNNFKMSATPLKSANTEGVTE